MTDEPGVDLSYLNDDSDAGTEEEIVESSEEVVEDPEEQDTEEQESDAEEEEPKGKASDVEEEPVARRKQSASERVQASRKQVAEEREKRIRVEAERDALLKFRSTTPAPDNSAAIQARNEKLQLMEPTERAVFLQAERIEQMNNQMMLSELRSEDRADKAAFDARATVDPRYARHAEAVEAKLKEMRSAGTNAPRKEVLAWVIGQKALDEKPKKGAREAAAQRVASTKSKPTSARSTQVAAAGKGDGLSDIEARLRGKSFSEMFGN